MVKRRVCQFRHKFSNPIQPPMYSENLTISEPILDEFNIFTDDPVRQTISLIFSKFFFFLVQRSITVNRSTTILTVETFSLSWTICIVTGAWIFYFPLLWSLIEFSWINFTTSMLIFIFKRSKTIQNTSSVCFLNQDRHADRKMLRNLHDCPSKFRQQEISVDFSVWIHFFSLPFSKWFYRIHKAVWPRWSIVMWISIDTETISTKPV